MAMAIPVPETVPLASHMNLQKRVAGYLDSATSIINLLNSGFNLASTAKKTKPSSAKAPSSASSLPSSPTATVVQQVVVDTAVPLESSLSTAKKGVVVGSTGDNVIGANSVNSKLVEKAKVGTVVTLGTKNQNVVLVPVLLVESTVPMVLVPANEVKGTVRSGAVVSTPRPTANVT